MRIALTLRKMIVDGNEEEIGRETVRTCFPGPSDHETIEVLSMAYFEDLTPYTYLNDPNEPPGTVNIGWLEPGYPFPTGTTSEEFRIRLEQLCHRHVNQMRGFHTCGILPARERVAWWGWGVPSR